MRRSELRGLLKTYGEVTFNFSGTVEGVSYPAQEIKEVIASYEFELEEAEKEKEFMFVVQNKDNTVSHEQGIFEGFYRNFFLVRNEDTYFKLDSEKILAIYPINP